jgi:ketosteroid isomerase-like protein
MALVLSAATLTQVPTRQATDTDRAAILGADDQLFHAAFQSCALDQLRPMIADDLQFFHDRTGLSARSGSELIGQLERRCASWRAGQAPGIIRVRVADRDSVHPLDGYGVLHLGEHEFHEVAPDGVRRLAETGRFAHIWHRLPNGQWQLARVISFDHVSAL